MTTITLPPLPEPWADSPQGWAYTADQMHAYAAAVLAAERISAAHWQALAEATLLVAKPLVDCRTCTYLASYPDRYCEVGGCTNGRGHRPLPVIKLWVKR